LGDVEGRVQSLLLIAGAGTMAAEFGGRGPSIAAASGKVAAKPFAWIGVAGGRGPSMEGGCAEDER
jgi:hypothetical protein